MSIAQGFWLRTLIVEVCRYPLRPPGPSYQIVKVGRVVPEQPSYAATSCVRAANSASIAAVEGQAALAATAGAAVATTAVGRVQAAPRTRARRDSEAVLMGLDSVEEWSEEGARSCNADVQPGDPVTVGARTAAPPQEWPPGAVKSVSHGLSG